MRPPGFDPIIAPKTSVTKVSRVWKKALALLAIAALPVVAGTALAQSLPQDPALQRALTDLQVSQTLQQTQANNTQLQLQLQQNEQRQQQLFNSMPPPAYQQPAWQQPQPLTPQK